MSWCRACGEFMLYPERHGCPPLWRAWYPEDETEDDAREFHATDGEEAAEKFAEHDDRNGDYSIVSGGHEVLMAVRRVDEGAIEYHYITGESVPTYSASEATLDYMKKKVSRLFRYGSAWEAGRLYRTMLQMEFPPQEKDT